MKTVTLHVLTAGTVDKEANIRKLDGVYPQAHWDALPESAKTWERERLCDSLAKICGRLNVPIGAVSIIDEYQMDENAEDL